MNIIDTSAAMARALDQPLDPDLKRLLTLRREQLTGEDDTRFIVIEPGDTVASIERVIGFPVLLDDQPAWEWVERHSGVIEVAFVFGDVADVLLLRESDGIDADLTTLLHRHAASELEQRRAITP